MRARFFTQRFSLRLGHTSVDSRSLVAPVDTIFDHLGEMVDLKEGWITRHTNLLQVSGITCVIYLVVYKSGAYKTYLK